MKLLLEKKIYASGSDFVNPSPLYPLTFVVFWVNPNHSIGRSYTTKEHRPVRRYWTWMEGIRCLSHMTLQATAANRTKKRKKHAPRRTRSTPAMATIPLLHGACAILNTSKSTSTDARESVTSVRTQHWQEETWSVQHEIARQTAFRDLPTSPKPVHKSKCAFRVHCHSIRLVEKVVASSPSSPVTFIDREWNKETLMVMMHFPKLGLCLHIGALVQLHFNITN